MKKIILYSLIGFSFFGLQIKPLLSTPRGVQYSHGEAKKIEHGIADNGQKMVADLADQWRKWRHEEEGQALAAVGSKARSAAYGDLFNEGERASQCRALIVSFVDEDYHRGNPEKLNHIESVFKEVVGALSSHTLAQNVWPLLTTVNSIHSDRLSEIIAARIASTQQVRSL